MKRVILIPIEDESLLILTDFMDFSDFAGEILSSKELEVKFWLDSEVSKYYEQSN